MPAGLSERELRQIRARYLARDEPRDYEKTLADLEGWVTALERQSPDDELILWFEHNLFDQLN